MKTKLLLLLFLIAFKLPAFAQNKVVKYCEVIGYNGETFNREKSKFLLSIGIVDSLFSSKDTNLKVQLQKVNSLKTSSDVLNYMSSIGWTLVTISVGDRFYFKKEFDPSELTTISNH